MKNLLAATAAVLAISGTAAVAGDLDFLGNTEYAFEAEAFSLDVGAEYTHGDFRMTPMFEFSDTSTTDFEFNTFSLEVGYTFTDSIEAYVRLETDADFEYDDVFVGASVRF
jgi:hypothetical protein